MRAMDTALQAGIVASDPRFENTLKGMGWSREKIERIQSWREQKNAEMTREIEERQERKRREQEEEDDEFQASVQGCSVQDLQDLVKSEMEFMAAYGVEDDSRRAKITKAELTRRGHDAGASEPCGNEAARSPDDGEPMQPLGIGFADADEAAGAQGAARRR